RVVRAGVPASRLHRMAPTPLAELAWQVHSLLAEDRTRARFLDQCLEYLRLRPEHPDRPPPLPFDTDDNIEPPDKPPLMLCERYAILAALHKVYCHQEAPVDPAPWPEGASGEEPGAQDYMAWVTLVYRARILGERHLPNLQACLAAVRKDLEVVLAEA